MTDIGPLDDLPDDPDAALAAEYVLRLLDPTEEAACARRIERDQAFAAEVARWQAEFEALDAAFTPVTPPAGMRARVEERLFGRPPSRLARLWGSAPLWRGLATAAVIAAVAVGILGRPAPPPDLPDLVVAVAPTVGDVELVALLDRTSHALRFTRIGGEAPPGQSLELWIWPASQAAPASLGVVPADPRFAFEVPPDYVSSVAAGTRVLVSVEPEGGSTTGQPTGEIVAVGALSEL